VAKYCMKLIHGAARFIIRPADAAVIDRTYETLRVEGAAGISAFQAD